MRLLRTAILILSLLVLMIPAYAQDEEVQLTWQERQAIRQQENWEEAVRRIAEVAETNAVELDLSGLLLTELPVQFYELTQLEVINLAGNCLHEWSSEIGNFVSLREFDLSFNGMTLPNQNGDDRFLPFVMPDEFFDLPQLEVLILEGFYVNSLSSEIGRLGSLKVLDLSRNVPLATLPGELANLHNLEVLHYGGINDGRIPDVIFRLSNLRELYIDTGARDPIVEIPSAIGNLTELEILHIQWSGITDLPSEITNLTNLHTLNLHHNNLTELPSEIFQIPNLRILNLNHNEIRELPPEIENLTYLQELHLNANHLTKLPDSIGNLSQLEQLHVTFNDLTSIPSTIGNLNQLLELDLTMNLLTEIPSEIGQLENLEILNLVANQLTEIPPEIGNLIQLTHLYLHRNHLMELPDEIGDLRNLEVLSVGTRYEYLGNTDNQIIEIPDNIGNLTNLRELHLALNPIQSLPSSISRLKNLEWLDLEYTRISRMPYAIADMNPYLRILYYSDLDETQLFPPVAIWWGNTGDVQHYLWWHRFWWWRVLPVGIVVGLYAFYRLIGWLWMRRQGAFVGKKKKKREV